MNAQCARISILAAVMLGAMPASAAAPVARNQTNSMAILSARYSMLLPYTDPDGGNMTFTLLSGPSRGYLERWRSGTYTNILPGAPVQEFIWYYTATGVNTGTDSFTWEVCDGTATSGVATMTIILTANNAPIANNQSKDIPGDCARRYCFLSYTHWDPYQPVVFFMVTPPAHGTVEYLTGPDNYVAVPTNTAVTMTVDDGWYYTPAPGYGGVDTLQWRVSDIISTSGVATYTFNVINNNPPVAHTIRAATAPGASVSFAARYTDPDFGQSRTAVVVQNAAHGNVTSAWTTLTYTPHTNGFKGVDTFTYKVNDGRADSNIATGFVQVRDPNERAGNLVILAVNNALWPNISNDVERLRTDLCDEGYTSKVYLAAGAITASNLWAYLRGEYNNANQWLTGAILIGNLPKAYLLCDLDKSHKCDLVYWNMSWFQTQGNAYYFDIWVSRMYATVSSYGNEVDLIKRALNSNHECRKGIARLPHKAYFYHAFENHSSYGPRLLEVWPSVAFTNEIGGDRQANAKFLPWRVDINEAGGDAMVAGGDVFQETSHGGYDNYMHGTFKTADLFRLIAQQRSCMIESCTSGDFGGIVNHHIFTRGGGCMFAVGGTEANLVEDFQMAGAGGEAFKLRASLRAGESWGGALLKNYPFAARNRTVYYGDLSMPAMVGSANEAPIVTNVTFYPGNPVPGQPVTFTAVVSDSDAASSDSPHANYEHQIEWFMAGYNAGRNTPTYVTNDTQCAAWTNITHAFSAPGTYTMRAEVMDEWRGRGWKEATVTVTEGNSPPIAVNDTATVEASHSVAIDVLANDWDPNAHALSVDAIITQPANGTATLNGDGIVHTSTNAWTGVDTFTYRVKDALGAAATGTVSVTVVADTTAPGLVRAWSWGDSNAVWALFDEPVEAGSGAGGAEKPANYALNYGVNVTGAVLQADTKTVKLLTSGLLVGLDYVLTVSQVRDRALAPNAIPAGRQAAFRYLPATVTVWVEDAVPGGALSVPAEDGWNWVIAAPTPFSGAKAHQSLIGAGSHQHYFQDATETLSVATGNALFTYIYLDPMNTPQEAMLQFRAAGVWDHRAYWGRNLIALGVNGTASRTNMGALPPAGRWARLEVPAAAVGVEGKTLDGMAFVLYGGRATWDYSGKCVGTFNPQVDFDGDGMSDNWEIMHFGNTGVSTGNNDADHDGMNDREEYLAGTDPNLPSSVLKISDSQVATGGTSVVFAWPSVAGKFYGVRKGTNLTVGLGAVLKSNLAATPPANVCTDAVNQAAGFYRIVLEPE
ncbi:MAG: Ig-like domain-containing protein [Verrucomicrobiota bacterium]|nr:Ig-like domain-containing protein [Verrucomicrobiota bacterium]